MINACILIGCGSYSDKEIPDLAFAASDAFSFGKTAISVCDVPKDNSYLLASGVAETSAVPTRAEIIRILAKGPEVAKRVTLDTLFFLFSGHGFRSPDTGIDYLLPEDAVTDALEDTALPLDFLIGKLRLWKARRTVMLIDACREQNGAKATIDREEAFGSKGLQYKGIATFSSCSPGERSFEAAGLRQGVFTAAVIEGLGPRGRCSTVYELDTFLQLRVPQLCQEHQKPSQHPYTVVEPLEMQGAVIVSEAMLRARQLANAIGRELREQAPLPVPSVGACMIALDFGTTSSAVAVIREGESRPEILPVSGQATLLPSAVHFGHDLDYIVGKSALLAARTDRDHAILYPKRDLGMAEIAPLNLSGQTIGAPLASSLIIASLKATAEAYLQRQVTDVYAAHPANYSTKQINALGEAFRLAGFDQIRFVTEPSIAAGVAVELAVERGTRFLVIDLGGGTLDVAGIDASYDVFEVLAVGGDRALGGLDYDAVLAKLLHSKAHEIHTDLIVEPSVLSQEAERIKIALGHQEVATALFEGAIDEHGEPTTVPIEISRAEAREAFKVLDGRVLGAINQVVRQMDNDFNAIVLSGQGTKQFSLRHEIETRFKEKQIVVNFQETAVIRGLGEYLRVLIGVLGEKWLLLDTLPRSFSVKCSSVRSERIRNLYGVDELLDVAAFSASDVDNKQRLVILKADTTVPTKRTIRCDIIDPKVGAVFAIDESFTGSTVTEEVMSVHLGPMTSGAELKAIKMDVDAAHTILVSLDFADEMSESFQLNNQFRLFHGHQLASESSEISARATVSGGLRVVKLPSTDTPNLMRLGMFGTIWAGLEHLRGTSAPSDCYPARLEPEPFVLQLHSLDRQKVEFPGFSRQRAGGAVSIEQRDRPLVAIALCSRTLL